MKSVSFLDFLSNTPKDQVSTKGVQWILSHLDGVRSEILPFIEPGHETAGGFGSAMLIDNALAEFLDPRIGLVCGKGSGHAFTRVAALKGSAAEMPGS
jgi:hypothetical protein